MMLSVAFRAPILALVLVSLMLIQNDGVVKAQFDTGAEVRTALDTTTSTNPKAQVVFYHDDVTTATTPGSYDVDHYYADCLTAIPVGTPAVGITGVTFGTTAAPDTAAAGTLDTPFFVSKCGTADVSACAQKTTYEYVLQQLNAITDNAIKTTVTAVSGDVTTTIKWCIRHRMLSSTGVENGYKAAIVTVTWVGDNTFAGTVTAAENGADNPDLNAGTVAVSAAACTNVATSVPVNYQQGENIQICLSATHNPPGGTPALVTIVKVNTLRFWIDFTPGGTNGVYDNGETTQLGMANGLPTGTTTILPANAGTGNTYCTQSFAANAPAPGPFVGASGSQGCVLSTLLAPAFFGSVAGTFVRYAGTVTVEFGSGSRRVLSVRGDHHHHRSVQQLKVGDQFDKTFVASVTTTAAADDSTCACSGFFLFKIICWIFKCLLGFD